MDKKAYKIRAQRLRENGGQHTEEDWEILRLSIFDNRCVCCGRRESLHKDHVVPVALGGSSGIRNLQPLCASCNAKKHTDATDYRKSFYGQYGWDTHWINGEEVTTDDRIFHLLWIFAHDEQGNPVLSEAYEWMTIVAKATTIPDDLKLIAFRTFIRFFEFVAERETR